MHECVRRRGAEPRLVLEPGWSTVQPIEPCLSVQEDRRSAQKLITVQVVVFHGQGRRRSYERDRKERTRRTAWRGTEERRPEKSEREDECKRARSKRDRVRRCRKGDETCKPPDDVGKRAHAASSCGVFERKKGTRASSFGEAGAVLGHEGRIHSHGRKICPASHPASVHFYMYHTPFYGHAVALGKRSKTGRGGEVTEGRCP